MTTEQNLAHNLSQTVQRQLGERRHYLQLAYEVAGRTVAAHDYPTLAELQRMADAVPAYLERIRAEEAARKTTRKTTAADRLAALEDAVRDGLPVDTNELARATAQAQAEAQAAELAEQGRKSREKAARELAKSQAAALAVVRKNPPHLDLEPTVTAVVAALDAAQLALDEYRAQVADTARTMREGGLAVVKGLGDNPPGLDPANHVGNGYVKLDGTIYAPADHLQRIRRRITEHPVMTGRPAT